MNNFEDQNNAIEGTVVFDRAIDETQANTISEYLQQNETAIISTCKSLMNGELRSLITFTDNLRGADPYKDDLFLSMVMLNLSYSIQESLITLDRLTKHSGGLIVKHLDITRNSPDWRDLTPAETFISNGKEGAIYIVDYDISKAIEDAAPSYEFGNQLVALIDKLNTELPKIKECTDLVNSPAWTAALVQIREYGTLLMDLFPLELE